MIAEDKNSQPSERRNFHPQKRELIGNRPGRAPPAWKANMAGAGGKAKAPVETGSKIFISMLPVDVVEKEVEVSTRSQQKSNGVLKLSYIGPFPAHCRAFERLLHGV